MTTYLITGANGQVGSQLVQQLQAQPSAIVIATDRNTLDITNRAAVFQAAQRLTAQLATPKDTAGGVQVGEAC